MCTKYIMKQKNEYQAYKKLTNIELFDHKQDIQFCSSIK